VDDARTLLWVLRTDLGLTGTKYGCGEGLCGSCTVVVDGAAERSCRLQMRDVEGKEVLTIEGLASGDELHPIQAAFVKHDALQCGFCTPGMILSGYGLLKENAEPTRQQIIEHMDDNLCRCGAHIRIIRAIEEASRVMKKGQGS
jgi:aerobic-type carbon monoxide dehydrogenase small subunit (CoxS/CutS family)